MRRRRLIAIAMTAPVIGCLLFNDPTADAQPNPVPGPPGPIGGSRGIGQAPGLGQPGPPGLTPAAGTIFLCPGVGAAANVILGIGGGYCDFDFTPVQLTANTFGVMHVHCEWGGVGPLLEMWNCWRVWAGQPDHPAHPDPDVIPDAMGVPWAINGPDPADQWPPPGLAPWQAFLPPPPPPEPIIMEPHGPPPGPPPGEPPPEPPPPPP